MGPQNGPIFGPPEFQNFAGGFAPSGGKTSASRAPATADGGAAGAWLIGLQLAVCACVQLFVVTVATRWRRSNFLKKAAWQQGLRS